MSVKEDVNEKRVGMVRVNTRISSPLNDWLDKRSFETGVPKSTLVMLALENYYREQEAFKSLDTLNPIMKKLQEIEERLKD